LTGGSVADSINGGAGADTLAGGNGADTIDGGAGVNKLDASGMVSQTDTGTVTSTGAVINLGATAITAGTIATDILAAGKYISGSLASVGAGQAGYLFGSNSASASAYVDTISNFTKIDGTTGADFIVGNASGAQTINGGTGGDWLTGGSGADTFVHATGDSVGYSATSESSTFTATDTITFGNGVDVISNFTAGTDTIDTATSGAAITAIGVATGLTTSAQNYYLSGDYVVATGVFTIAADGVGADTLVMDNADAGATIDVNTSYIVLIGVNSANLVAGSFS